jgi:hypothetical protein
MTKRQTMVRNTKQREPHKNGEGRWWVLAVVFVLDLQLPMQSVPIITDVVGSNLDQGEVYNNM